MTSTSGQAAVAKGVGTDAAQAGRCLHCHQPIPRSSGAEFCCAGCARVHDLLLSSGLDRYYALRGDAPVSPAPVSLDRAPRPWLELMEAAQSQVSGIRQFALDVQGIQCGACGWLIEAVFNRMNDAYRMELNPALGRASLQVGPAFVLRDFVTSVEQFGYQLGPETKTSTRGHTLTLRTAVCLALAGNTMFLSAALYLGLSEGPLYDLIQQAIFALTTLCALVGGSYFVDRAYRGLKRGILHLDLPIALGMGLAYFGSAWSFLWRDGAATYFDTVSVFIALMLVGRLLQERLVERNRKQLLATDGSSGLLTRRIAHGQPELVTCPNVRTGDRLLICSGEIVPVEAQLVSRRASCSLSWISGESRPRVYLQDQMLPAGAINLDESAFEVTARTDFEHSSLDALLRTAGRSEGRRQGDFWDRLARGYVLAVLSATALGAAIWLARGAGLQTVLDVAVAVLVVSCPCAFGIAAPLAYELGIAGLRKAGLFVRTTDFFDRAAKVSRVVFDKTGTLTTGALSLRDPDSLSALTADSRRILFDLASRSSHPKSAAIAKSLRERFPDTRMSDAQVTEQRGLGMELSEGGVRFRLGAPHWALEDAAACEGPVFSAGGHLLASLTSEEVARPDAASEVGALIRFGLTPWIASGDRQPHVDALADRLGVARARARGDLTPEDKAALVRSLDAEDTLMLGDGINDGPALEGAYCSGTPAIDKPFVPARSDFYFLTPGLLPVRMALATARRVRRVVRSNLIFAALYNLGAIALCYAGLMRPWLAALLMPASSILVLAYTAFALSWRKPWKS